MIAAIARRSVVSTERINKTKGEFDVYDHKRAGSEEPRLTDRPARCHARRPGRRAQRTDRYGRQAGGRSGGQGGGAERAERGPDESEPREQAPGQPDPAGGELRLRSNQPREPGSEAESSWLLDRPSCEGAVRSLHGQGPGNDERHWQRQWASGRRLQEPGEDGRLRSVCRVATLAG